MHEHQHPASRSFGSHRPAPHHKPRPQPAPKPTPHPRPKPGPKPTPAPAPTPTPTPDPSPTPSPTPSGDYPGRSTPDSSWRIVFETNFPTLLAPGKMFDTNGNGLGAYSDIGAYPTEFDTTSKVGYYEPNNIGVVATSDGHRVLRCVCKPGSANPNGRPSGTAPYPKVADTMNERWEMAVRLPQGGGHHAANLAWPQKDSDWPTYGEGDFFEVDLTGTSPIIGGYLHVQNGAADGHDQVQLNSDVRLSPTAFATVGYQRVAGKSFDWLVNGKVVQSVTGSKVPAGPMHIVLQTEDGDHTTGQTTLEYLWWTLWTK